MIGPWQADGVWKEAEFDALFRSHFEPIYRHLYRIVGTREEAEDLAQEAFLRLYRHPFAPDREHNVRGWLYTVATNLAYNALRGANRRFRRQERALQEEHTLRGGAGLGIDSADPMEAAIRSDEREAVRQALAALPERQAKLLLLRYGGLSYREVADVVGVAPGSVGTLLARAEKAFAKAYDSLRKV